MPVAADHYPDAAGHREFEEGALHVGDAHQKAEHDSHRPPVDVLHKLKETVFEGFILMTLLISIGGTIFVDLWGLTKLWHAIFK